MRFGIVTECFQRTPFAEAARLIREAGFVGVQLHVHFPDAPYWAYNRYVEGLTPAICREVSGAFQAQGLEIWAAGVYTSLVERDPDKLRRNLEWFKAAVGLADHLGTRVLVTESGRCASEAETQSADTWRRLLDSTAEVLRVAEERDVVLAFEPYHLDALGSCGRVLDFIRELGSTRIKVMLDPANIMVADPLERQFDLLGPHLVGVHAKDVVIEDGVVLRRPAAGEGQIDYPRFMRLVEDSGKPLMLEYVDERNYLSVKQFVDGAIAAARG